MIFVTMSSEKLSIADMMDFMTIMTKNLQKGKVMNTFNRQG